MVVTTSETVPVTTGFFDGQITGFAVNRKLNEQRVKLAGIIVRPLDKGIGSLVQTSNVDPTIYMVSLFEGLRASPLQGSGQLSYVETWLVRSSAFLARHRSVLDYGNGQEARNPDTSPF